MRLRKAILIATGILLSVFIILEILDAQGLRFPGSIVCSDVTGIAIICLILVFSWLRSRSLYILECAYCGKIKDVKANRKSVFTWNMRNMP